MDEKNELSSLKALVDLAKEQNDPEILLGILDMDVATLNERIVSGSYSPKGKEARASALAAARATKLEKELAAYKAKEEAEKEEFDVQALIKQVKEELTEDEAPYTKSLGFEEKVARALKAAKRDGKDLSSKEMVKQLEEAVSSDVKKLAASPKAVETMLKDANVKRAFAKALGLEVEEVEDALEAVGDNLAAAAKKSKGKPTPGGDDDEDEDEDERPARKVRKGPKPSDEQQKVKSAIKALLRS
jgi:hypothetical protein